MFLTGNTVSKKEKKEDKKVQAADMEKIESDDDAKGCDDDMGGKSMDAAISDLRSQFDGFKKNGIKAVLSEVKKRDELLTKLTPFIGSFTISDVYKILPLVNHECMNRSEIRDSMHVVHSLSLFWTLWVNPEVIAVGNLQKRL